MWNPIFQKSSLITILWSLITFCLEFHQKILYHHTMISHSSSQKPKILIDCDPGADDFFALIWALWLHKKWIIEVVAITTTGGNVGADLTYLNALRACEFIGITWIPVGKSDVAPLTRGDKGGFVPQDASHIHGSDGLGEASRFLPKVKAPKKIFTSRELIKKNIKNYPDTQVLVFGPMTNIAQYIASKEGKKHPINRVIAMGGAVTVPGNVTPVAEFNIAYDPESADEVLTTVERTVLLPLDVTSQLIFTRREMKTILNHISWLPPSPARRGSGWGSGKNGVKYKFLEALTLHTFKTNMAFRETAGTEGFLVHDASVVAMLLYPHLFSGRFLPLRVETKGEFTRGETVTDMRNIAQPTTHTFVVDSVDRDRFMEAMVQDFLSFL